MSFLKISGHIFLNKRLNCSQFPHFLGNIPVDLHQYVCLIFSWRHKAIDNFSSRHLFVVIVYQSTVLSVLLSEFI